jgi:hypothetical protein
VLLHALLVLSSLSKLLLVLSALFYVTHIHILRLCSTDIYYVLVMFSPFCCSSSYMDIYYCCSFSTIICHDTAQAARLWLLPAQTGVRSWVASSKVRGRRSGIAAGLSPSSSVFPGQSPFHYCSIPIYDCSMVCAMALGDPELGLHIGVKVISLIALTSEIPIVWVLKLCTLLISIYLTLFLSSSSLTTFVRLCLYSESPLLRTVTFLERCMFQ